MDLTPEQESEIIERNMQKIYRAVDNYTSRCSSDVVKVPYEDFVQEVSIAFLRYIRKCETPEQLEKFPWFDAMNAMRNAVFAFQPLSCPRTTRRFSEIIHDMPKTVSCEVLADSGLDIDGMSHHWVDDKETQIDFDAFMSNFGENERRMVGMRMYGMKMKEIADQFGVVKSTAFKQLRKIGGKYHDFVNIDRKDDENG